MISGIALAGPDRARSEIGMQVLAAGLIWVHVGSRGQLMTFGADAGKIEKDLRAQLPLKAERPALRVGDAEVLL
jgi:hypothetical protein